MSKSTDLISRIQGWQRPAGKDPDALRIDYLSASRGLKKSIFVIYLIGLGVILVADIIYYETGNKSGMLFLMDILLYHVAALVLGSAVYRLTTRGWQQAYATESALVSIADVSADAVYAVSTDSLITAWSTGAERIFGYKAGEAIGQSIGIVLPDDFLERDALMLGPLLDDGIVTGHRTLSRRKGGEIFPSEVSASLQKAPDGEVASVLFVLRDVTRQVSLETELHEARDELEVRVEERTQELKEANRQLKHEIGDRVRAEVALKESEEHFRSLIENATDLIVVVDHLGRVEYVSPSITGVLGFDPGELGGVSALSLAHPEDLDRVSGQLAETTKQTGITTTAEFRFRHRDGSFVMLEGVGTSVIDELGNIRVIINARDITERKNAEEQIRGLNRELEQRIAELNDLNVELEAFSFSVSHDLRAPLRAIRGFSEMLEENTPDLDAESRQLLDQVTGSAEQMGELIEGLLSFSRLGRQEMRRVTVDMRELATRVFDEAVTADGWEADLGTGILPPATGDPLLLHQVYTNLIGNALKFSSKVPHPALEVGSLSDGGEVVYFVRDNGVGFDMAYADKLFGVFKRLHSEDEFEGTGIGLANVQRIVHRHSGRIWAESIPGEGAAFYFTIPEQSAGT